MYFALIQPHFDYCCSVWNGLGETLSTKIQKLQNRAVRVITRSSYDTNASVLLNALQLDNLYVRRRKLKAQLMFKILKGICLHIYDGCGNGLLLPNECYITNTDNLALRAIKDDFHHATELFSIFIYRTCTL